MSDLEIPRLILGTAQFGSDYGIANQTGKPSYHVLKSIIATAFDFGITTLDTAAGYGSEQVLGKILEELGLRERALVATKIYPLEDRPKKSNQTPDLFIRNSVKSSLRNLGLETLHLCLFHRVEDLRFLDTLLELRGKGLVQHIGVSVYTPEQALHALSIPAIEVIQHPTSVLDQRFLRQGVLGRALDQGVFLFARSLYLQGLVVLSPEKIPGALSPVIPVLIQITDWARRLHISKLELCLRFGLSLKGVAGVVVGMETLDQVQENMRIFQKGPLDQSILEEIHREIPDLPKSVLHPNQWPITSTL